MDRDRRHVRITERWCGQRHVGLRQWLRRNCRIGDYSRGLLDGYGLRSSQARMCVGIGGVFASLGGFGAAREPRLEGLRALTKA